METDSLQRESVASRSSTPPALAGSMASHQSSEAILDLAEADTNSAIDVQNLNENDNQISCSVHNSTLSILEKHESDFVELKEDRRLKFHEAATDKSLVEASYYTNSKKEVLALAYIENFNRQYCYLYPGRKELMLIAPNEFETRKFICTTIRPTQPPFKELYDYRTCASFLADYLTYEPLNPPHELPKVVPSPSYTLKLQSGNCFDYSIALVSFLRGVGYDAYVVSGYATKDITMMDRSKKILFDVDSLVSKNVEKSDLSLQISTNSVDRTNMKYKVKQPRQLSSQFILKQETKKSISPKKLNDKNEAEKSQTKNLVDDDDELMGLRIHSWVLVLPGKREISEAFFIESTTAEIYPTDHDYYLGVESVFSSANYWVNMQICAKGLKGISFDLGDTSKWEFTFLENNKPGGIKNKNRYKKDGDGDADGDGSDEEGNQESPSEVLDLPKSWVSKLSISKEQFESKCPSGSKCISYKNVKYETFAEYFRKDGMTLRVTLLEDESGKISEYYENRRDKLRERIRLPNQDIIHEYYNPGRMHGLKEHIIQGGITKEMIFYPSARSDGLYHLMKQQKKFIEKFVDREDFLTYRSVTFVPCEEAKEYTDGIAEHIIKMTEKFEYNGKLLNYLILYRRHPFIGKCSKNNIFLIYKLEPGKIIPSYTEFKKPALDQKGHSIEVLGSFKTNPFAKEPKKQHLFLQVSELLNSEQLCLNSVKFSEREVNDILAARLAEELDVTLTISVYDTIRNSTKIPIENESEQRKEEEESKNSELDYLSPFLLTCENPKNLSKDEAISVKDACLKSLKERLVEKANIIQSRLDEVSSEYQQRQILYSKNADSMTLEETDEYVRYCNEALFKIHVLEKRLSKHKETAPEKFIELDAKLRIDPRLKLAAI